MATRVLDPAVVELVDETPYRGRIEPRGAMRVLGVVFTSRALLPEASGDQALRQVVRDRGLQQVGTPTVDV